LGCRKEKLLEGNGGVKTVNFKRKIRETRLGKKQEKSGRRSSNDANRRAGPYAGEILARRISRMMITRGHPRVTAKSEGRFK